MTLSFNLLLEGAGIELKDVRLLRHQEPGLRGRTPYSLWRDDPSTFEDYQSCQAAARASYLAAPFWASFVVPPDGGTLFVGLYEVGEKRPLPVTWKDPLSGEMVGLRTVNPCEQYDVRLCSTLSHYSGRLRIDWGKGTRSWVQRPDRPTGDKPIVELARVFREPDFPGYARFISNLAAVSALPSTWVGALRAVRGVYLLTCPRTREQYVGSASGVDGFWGRWQAYVASGHGGNEGLKSRDPSDYQISILEVAGSLATSDEIVAMEHLWKLKLQSREMGLNRN